jgi:DNA-binding response OmpR family regulator
MRPTHIPNPHKLRTLLIHGHRPTADTLGQLFTACGQEVLVAYDGPFACDLARILRPEVVLLDLRLSDEETSRRLRQYGTTLVAITTADGEEAFRSSGHDFAHYLVEPIDPIQVEALLKKLARPR